MSKMKDIVYSNKKFRDGWSGGLPETPCGKGSTLRSTEKQRKWIPILVLKYEIETISDIGAGDLNWIEKVIFPKFVLYKAFDLIPRRPEVVTLDILKIVPPKSDLIMCLWVFNHFTEKDIKKAMQNIIDSGSKYLLVTQREGYFKYPFNIVDMITLNEKKDCLMLVRL